MEKRKNCWIIPTDKSSRLHEFGNIWFNHKEPTECFRNYNIYITNNKKIKEKNWLFSSKTNNIFKADSIEYLESHNMIEDFDKSFYINSKYSKKIIMTTDPKLIADGIQAIDNEFLEWFIKNPSCDEVEVYEVYGKLYAEPIISKKEPKQESLEKLAKDFYLNENQLMERIAFKRGYTECKEKMYSEEDMIAFGKLCHNDAHSVNKITTFKELLKQFKKK